MSEYAELMRQMILAGQAQPATGGGVPPAPTPVATPGPGPVPEPVTPGGALPPAPGVRGAALKPSDALRARKDQAGTGTSFMQGLLYNFYDELGGAVAEIVPGGEDYRGMRDKIRLEHAREHAENPVGAFAAEVGGGILSGLGVAGAGRVAATRLAAAGAEKTARAVGAVAGTPEHYAASRGILGAGAAAAKTGAAQGAIAGAGSADTLGDTAGSAVGGAMLGGALGAGVGMAVGTGGKAARGVSSWWQTRASRAGDGNASTSKSASPKARMQALKSKFFQEEQDMVLSAVRADLGLPADASLDAIAKGLREQQDLFIGAEASTRAQRLSQAARVPVHALSDKLVQVMNMAVLGKQAGAGGASGDLAAGALRDLEVLWDTTGRRGLQLYGKDGGVGKRTSKKVRKGGSGAPGEPDFRQWGPAGGGVDARVMGLPDATAMMNDAASQVRKGFEALFDARVPGNVVDGVATGGVGAGQATLDRLAAARSAVVGRLASGTPLNPDDVPVLLHEAKQLVRAETYKKLDGMRLVYRPIDQTLGVQSADAWVDEMIGDGGLAVLSGDARSAGQLGQAYNELSGQLGRAADWSDLAQLPGAQDTLNRAWQMRLLAREMNVDDRVMGSMFQQYKDAGVERADGFLGSVDRVKTWQNARVGLNKDYGRGVQRADGAQLASVGQAVDGLNRWALNGGGLGSGAVRRAMVSSPGAAPAGEEALWLGANKLYGLLDRMEDAYSTGVQGAGAGGFGALRTRVEKLAARAGQPLRGRADAKLEVRGANAELMALRAGLFARLMRDKQALTNPTGGPGRLLASMAASRDDVELLLATVRKGKDVREDAEAWVKGMEIWRGAHRNLEQGVKNMRAGARLGGGSGPRQDRLREMAIEARSAMLEIAQGAAHGWIPFWRLQPLRRFSEAGRLERELGGRADVWFEALSGGVDDFVRVMDEGLAAGQLQGLSGPGSVEAGAWAWGANPLMGGVQGALTGAKAEAWADAQGEGRGPAPGVDYRRVADR